MERKIEDVLYWGEDKFEFRRGKGKGDVNGMMRSKSE